LIGEAMIRLWLGDAGASTAAAAAIAMVNPAKTHTPVRREINLASL
jgi:hypothetical protein